MGKDLRIDKWLWAVRVFKTRSLASDACRAGKVKIKEQTVKPSRTVVINDIISVCLPPITRTIKVLALLQNRVSAKLVSSFMEDLTSPEEYKKLELLKDHRFMQRDGGSGRPTKKERRYIDNTILN
jgi:ribosome-associated heat shock protein Hsp15